MTRPELKRGGKERRKSWRSEDNLHLALGSQQGHRADSREQLQTQAPGQAPEVEQVDARAPPGGGGAGGGAAKAGRLSGR